jgi:nucleoside-diphosphate-sugar epimerase
VRDPSEIATVLVTGGSGFLGRHCVDALKRRGVRVHAVSRSREDINADGITWHKLDLHAQEAAAALIAKLRPSHLLHLAWITAPDRYRHAADNLDWLETSLAVMRAFGECGGERFVGVGSCAEYDVSGGHCKEDATPIRPPSLYGQCKAACWAAAQAYARHYGFSAAWARVFVPYGPGDAPQRLIPSLISAMSARTSIDVTDGSQIRDFIYATDVAKLLVALLSTPDAAGAYNAGTGRGVSVRRVIELVADYLDARELVHFGARPQRNDEPFTLVADTTKVERALNWRAGISVESGLEQLLRRPDLLSPEVASDRRPVQRT